MRVSSIALLALVATGWRAQGAEAPDRVRLFVGTGLLGTSGAVGGSVFVGVRLGIVTHAAFSFDLGYGTMSASPAIQDRWWLMPSVAFVIPTAPGHIDLGVGLGLATATGFASWRDYLADQTTYSFQLVPAVRAHAVAAFALTRRVALFFRVGAGALVLDGNSIGIRDGPARPLKEVAWVSLSIGVELSLL